MSAVDHPRGGDCLHGQVQVGIFQDNRRRLAAEFEVELGDILRCRRHDPLTGGNAAGEVDHVHSRAGTEGMADCAAGAANDVDHALGQIRFGQQPGKFEAVDRCFFAGFEDDGIAGDQGRSELARDQEKREVPRQNPGHHAQRFTKHEDVFAWSVAGENFPFQTPAPLSHVIQIVGGEVDLHQCQTQYLALFGGDDPRQSLGILADLGGDAVQIACAFVGRLAGPGFLRRAGGGNGTLDFAEAGLRYRTQQFTVGRVEDFNQTVAGAEGAVDVALIDG